MRCIVLVIVLSGLGWTPFAEAETVKHTGVLVSVRPDQPAITLEEMGPWTGPKQGMMTRSITLTPETKVVTVTRSKQASPDGWWGAFVESPLAATSLKPGDYVTVTTETRDGRLVARTVQVLQPSPEAPGR
jgi:hypothetical protein